MSMQIGKSYNFETHAASLLGASYKAVTVVAVMDYLTAIKERDVTAVHHNVFGSLPEGTPDDPAATNYVRIRLPSGQFTILGYSWIREDTIEEVSSMSIVANVLNVTTEDVSRIRDVLVIAGYPDVTLELKTLAAV